MNDSVLIELDNISARNGNQPVFRNTCWQLRAGQQWAIIGPNGSGKSTLASLLNGRHPVSSGIIHYATGFNPKTDIATVSFEEQQSLCARDQKLDMSEYSPTAFDPGTTVAEAILQGRLPDSHFTKLLESCQLHAVQNRGIRFISSGEMRKTLIARALFNKPRLLILDNPLESLDAKSRQQIAPWIEQLLLTDMTVLLLARQQQDVLANTTHLMIIENGQISAAGTLPAVKQSPAWARMHRTLPPLPEKLPAPDQSRTVLPPLAPEVPLIKLENISVRYGDELILDRVSWIMQQGQHTAILGPNGAGKTTLLNLVTGDNPRAYGQEVWLCGNKRGCGESIWEVKQKLGLVSNALQQAYTRSSSVFDVVASGFFDTIGLYDPCSPTQQDIAKEWLSILELASKVRLPYKNLSFGEQRLVLLARAMVKSPVILILDEPCSGLDDYHRRHILQLIDFIAAQGVTHIVYVSHHADEQPSCINQQLVFVPKATTGYELRCILVDSTQPGNDCHQVNRLL